VNPLDLLKRILPHLAIAMITIMSLLALSWIAVDSWIMPKIARSGWEVVTVPDITGLDADIASRTIAAAGLEPVIAPERKSARHLGPDMVAMQKPIPNDSVKKGHIVRIWLSAGSTTVPVPDLTGQDSIEASTHLREAGLEIESLEWMSSTRVSAGLVVRSEPAAGVLIVQGTTVKLVISSGADPDSTLVADSSQSTTPPRVF